MPVVVQLTGSDFKKVMERVAVVFFTLEDTNLQLF